MKGREMICCQWGEHLIQSDKFATCHEWDLRGHCAGDSESCGHTVRAEQGLWPWAREVWRSGRERRELERYAGPEKWQKSVLPSRLWMEWLLLWATKLQDKDVVRIYTSHQVWESLSQQLSRKTGPTGESLGVPDRTKHRAVTSQSFAKGIKQKHFNSHWW